MKLKDKKCVPCEDSKTKPLTSHEAKSLLKSVPEWTLAKNVKKISRTWIFSDFMTAMKFINKIAKVAEKQGHHPDIYIWYNKVTVEFSTHSIGGLAENDFIMAAKVDVL